MTQTITRAGHSLAYHATPGRGPGVVFLGGLRSDMSGTKAVALEEWARASGRAFLRLDYSGHGASGGTFEGGSIGDWCADALAVIEAATEGPQVLVGSSMGGWIALLVARDRPERVAGLVTIAAAPDFTEDGYWAGFTEKERLALMTHGRVAVPSEYGEPFVITRHLIEEARDRLVLRTPLELGMPVRMLQGTADDAVPVETATRLIAHASGGDIRLTLVKGADHRFSGPEELALIREAVTEVLARV
ncbi:alpha/beta hydrolase [uncultured Jannaschia sp.]|uniref:alpha/beta fold hydrolase n=1 Tax=uncultured Jannaschia sp. TaxID=293347 RepID=UPI002634E937|nr:alpha/beta hydrolase [uncultured Jannaschia sp.]